MKKLFILIIAIFFFLLVLLLSIFIDPKYDKGEKKYTDYSNLILNNSSWISLTKDDFNSLILKTYSENILTIISSLENSIPIIIEVHGGSFSDDGKNNFIVASAFDSNQNVHIYLYDDNNNYTKTTSSLEMLLENAVGFFAINNEEVFK